MLEFLLFNQKIPRISKSLGTKNDPTFPTKNKMPKLYVCYIGIPKLSIEYPMCVSKTIMFNCNMLKA